MKYRLLIAFVLCLQFTQTYVDSLKALLKTITDKSIDRFSFYILKKEFNEWRGELEQVDDVLLIGIKI